MARITVENCIDIIPSRFELVLIASQRARKLHTGDQPTVEKENDKNTVIALREIEEQTISFESLKEDLIKDYQSESTYDYEDEDLELVGNRESTKSFAENIEEEIKSLESAEVKKLEKQSEMNDANQTTAENIEEEIKSLESAEDKKLEEQYEVNDANQNTAENIASDSHENQE